MRCLQIVLLPVGWKQVSRPSDLAYMNRNVTRTGSPGFALLYISTFTCGAKAKKGLSMRTTCIGFVCLVSVTIRHDLIHELLREHRCLTAA